MIFDNWPVDTEIKVAFLCNGKKDCFGEFGCGLKRQQEDLYPNERCFRTADPNFAKNEATVKLATKGDFDPLIFEDVDNCGYFYEERL